MPRVSIVIPVYNTAAYLKAALDSVLRQTYSDWEVIVVDDGSTDNTRSLVASCMPAFSGKLRYIYQSNRGLPAARNTALQNSSGVLVALLDADDVWLDHRLERGVGVMDGNPEVGLVHAKVARINTSGEVIEEPVTPAPKYLSGKIARHIYARRAHILCPTVMFRKECLDLVGMFDETMCSTEDRDLWFRIAERYSVAYVNEILAHYRVSPASMSSNLERMMTWQLFFIEKHRKRGPCGKAAALQAFSNLHRERGDLLFKNHKLRQAMSWYFKAVRCNPLSIPNLYMLFRAMGEPLLAKLRRVPGTVGPTTSF
jgi:glycosyltransferase involved in cell wall biosynthesis